jgi:ssDNA-binding Zn-finger/Zn-ribbon topoisomerase 1
MKCIVCGLTATCYNDLGAPTCSRHKKEKTKQVLCPDCKSLMVIRKGKFGSFWGCSAYPMCEGIRKI